MILSRWPRITTVTCRLCRTRLALGGALLKQGDRHTAVVSTFETDADENLTALVIELAILKDDIEAAGRAAAPMPGTAPWAPRIIRAPPARWPVVIPLSLLAGIAFGAWLLMERGLLPSLAWFAGAP